MLHEFFAVTLTSVYHVKDKDAHNNPEAVKIATAGESAIAVGGRLNNGTMIAICNQLIAYIPEGGGLTSFQRKIEHVNTRYWGGHTTEIVALFKSKAEAFQCFESENRQPCDQRWLKQTKEVIDEIGEDHPAFEVCHWPDLALIPG